MSYSVFFILRKKCHSYNLILLSFIFLSASCGAKHLKDDEELKKMFRPLKYSSDCNNFCKNIICQPIEECIDGVILPSKSYCNCCPVCVKFLDVGQDCTEEVSGTLALGSESRCKKGTFCEDGKCKLNPDIKSCLRHIDIRKKHNETGKYVSEIWIPQCDEEGNYAAKQKKISKSICFDNLGNRIFGSADDALENTCVCSRLMLEKEHADSISFNAKAHEHCTQAGSFDSLQCINNLCYCADENTGEVKSEILRMDFVQNLPCYDSNSHTENYLKDCEIELLRSKKMAEDFRKKGVKILGFDTVKCDPDGTYSPTQCKPERCVCTNKEGVGINSYYADIKNIKNGNMTCNCARDVISIPFMGLSCATNGSYISTKCFQDECVCVDEDGETISPTEFKEGLCETLNLGDYPKEGITASTTPSTTTDTDDYYDDYKR